MPDRYAHDPDAFDGDEYAPDGAEDPDNSSGEVPHASDPDPESHGTDAAAAAPEAVDREFDWRGWTLVAAIVVAFLLVPGVIYLYPRVGPAFGLTFWDTYLVLPLLPAVVLGILAVWATTRP